jgi:hypothetical protein
MSGNSGEMGTRDDFGGARRPAQSRMNEFATGTARHLVALVFLVGFPALMTAMSPVSCVKFQRHDGRVSATAKTCLLFVIPYRTVSVDPVVSISDRFVAGTVTREVKNGRVEETKSQDEGYLMLQGGGQAAEIPVTPFNLQSVVARSKAFLNDPQSEKLSMFVVANWKFSILVGGLLSLLTVLYLGIIVFIIVRKMVHMYQSALGVPPEERWLVNLEAMILAASVKALPRKVRQPKRKRANS